MKNILVSTTKQWNPGDEFIWYGVRKLWEAASNNVWNYHLWNRNPDQFVDGWDKPFMAPQRWTNSLRAPGLDLMDAVLFAGSPEWLGPTVEPIYRELLNFPLPLFCIGVGSGSDELRLSPLEREVLSRPQTLILCRSKELSENINNQLSVSKAIPLPCPAFFCGEQLSEIASRKGLILQDSNVQNQSIPESAIQSLLKKHTAFDEIVHFYYSEFFRFQRMTGKSSYSFESKDYLERIFPRLGQVVSTRLHGALACLSLGIPTAVVDFGNYRVNTTCRLFNEILPSLKPADAVDWILEAPPADSSKNIAAFREKVWRDYLNILRPFAKDHLL